MAFEDEPPGTIFVQFDDRSAIVRGDGTPQEAAALRQILLEQGVEEDAAEGIARVLLAQGMTMRPNVPPSSDPRTMSGRTFEALADAIGRTN